jgi:hypothetical protein
MLRAVSLAIVITALAFPAFMTVHAQHNEPEVIEWNQLPQWGEKSLAPDTGARVYRESLWTPFWGQALARLTLRPDGTGELVTKLRDYDEPHSITTSSRVLEKSEVDAFLSAVTDAHFWSLPVDAAREKNPRYSIKDADICILEAMADGKYYAVRRLSLRTNSAFTRACEYFVRPAIVSAAKAKQHR